jgi:hypothetical protein
MKSFYFQLHITETERGNVKVGLYGRRLQEVKKSQRQKS